MKNLHTTITVFAVLLSTQLFAIIKPPTTNAPAKRWQQIMQPTQQNFGAYANAMDVSNDRVYTIGSFLNPGPVISKITCYNSTLGGKLWEKDIYGQQAYGDINMAVGNNSLLYISVSRETINSVEVRQGESGELSCEVKLFPSLKVSSDGTRL